MEQLNTGRWQFGLCTLFLVSIAIGIAVAYECNGIRRRANAVSVIERVGGYVHYDFESDEKGRHIPNAIPPGATWLKKILGNYFLSNVVEAQIYEGYSPKTRGPMTPERFTDDDVAQLDVLTDLEWLVLINTSVSDEGLEHLKGLKKLRRLDLDGSRVTEAGAESLHALCPI